VLCRQRIHSRKPELGSLAWVFAKEEEEESARSPVWHADRDGDQAAVPRSAQTRLSDDGDQRPGRDVIAAVRGRLLVVKDRDSGLRVNSPRQSLLSTRGRLHS
jgi:hypothetical protein